MKIDANEIEVNGVKYVPKDSQVQIAKRIDGLKYVIVRSGKAGVFAGYLKHRDGQKVDLVSARRLWYWSGAASLSQLAMEGVKKPGECKFPCEVDAITVLEVIEIIGATERCRRSIEEVKIWKV